MVPLRDEGYAVGVVARTSRKGAMFGYFFGPRLASAGEALVARLVAEKAVLVGKFGDLQIVRGNWPVIGQVPSFDPSAWRLPSLVRIDEVAHRAWLSTYDDGLHVLREEEIGMAGAARHPRDGLMGAGAVEIILTRLLNEPGADSGPRR